jgi:hypothetical protein
MRQTISGLVAAIAVMTASAVPAMACGGGLFQQGSCSPCGQAYVEPCAQPQVYVAPYTGCNTCGGGWGYERLPDPVEQYHSYASPLHQYYYVNQGPTYTGPGDLAPRPIYREGGVSDYGAYRHHAYRYGYEGGAGYYGYRTHPRFRPWRHTSYRYTERPAYRYGYAPHRGYAPHFYGHPHSMRYGSPMGMPRAYGYHEHMMREHMLRRYY